MFLLSLTPLMDELSDRILMETRRKILELLEEAMSWKRNIYHQNADIVGPDVTISHLYFCTKLL